MYREENRTEGAIFRRRVDSGLEHGLDDASVHCIENFHSGSNPMDLENCGADIDRRVEFQLARTLVARCEELVASFARGVRQLGSFFATCRHSSLESRFPLAFRDSHAQIK